MNKVYYITVALLVFTTALMSGCANPDKRAVTTALVCDPETTPPGEQCIVDYSGSSSLGDGTITKALFVVGGVCYENIPDGKGAVHRIETPCPKKLVGMKWVDDRGNTVLKSMGGAFVTAAGGVIEATQMRRASDHAANKGFEAVKYQTDKALDSVKYQVDNQKPSGPGFVILNQNQNQSGATAVSQQSSEVKQSSSDCPGCYDPTE